VSALFFVASAVAIFSSLMTITSVNAVHALLYFIVSLFSSAVMFYLLGAPFVAALEVIVYAGAIIVLFLFAVMLLNLGKRGVDEERRLMKPSTWIGPALLAAILVGEMVLLLSKGMFAPVATEVVGAKRVGLALFGPYLLGVEIASMLLLAGLVGAYHLGRKETPPWTPRGPGATRGPGGTGSSVGGGT
jgi:NADH-quinone oxidoreductase subunit J